MSYRIGLVGTGGVAKAHFTGYQAVLGDRINVAAACDPNRSTLDAYCDERNIPLRFTDTRSFLESGEVDVIVLLTEPKVRADYIFPSLDKGIHVLVEKPFGNTYRECLEYVEAAEQSNATLAVSQNLRFYPDIEWARERVTEGDLGELTYIHHDHFQWRMSTGGWRNDEERLEISIFSIHILDRTRWVAGLVPEQMSALTARSWDASGPRGEIFTDLRVEFEGGAIGQMTSSWFSRIPENRFRVDGKKGSLVTSRESATADDACATIEYEDGRKEKQTFTRENASRKAFGHSLRHLIDALDEGREPIHSGRDNLQTMTIVDGAYLSAERGGDPVTAEEIQTR